MVHRRRSAFVARQIGQHAFHFMSSTFVPFHLLTGGRRESPSLPSEAVVLVAAGCTHLRVGSLAHRNLSPTLLRILSLFSGCRARHFLFHHLYVLQIDGLVASENKINQCHWWTPRKSIAAERGGCFSCSRLHAFARWVAGAP